MQPIQVYLEDESGNAIEGPATIFDAALPAHDDARFQMMRFVDPYGDTTFNYLQITAVLRDL
jgi:hypothetical protein